MKTLSLSLCLSLALSLTSHLAKAADGFEELTYDDLVQELNMSRTKIKKASDPQPEPIQFHLGIGWITSNNLIDIEGYETNKPLNGFQLALGIDLTTQFQSEFNFRNYGESKSANESRSMRELEARALFHDLHVKNVGYRFGGGLGQRNFQLSDSASGLRINDSTPFFLLFGGVETKLSKQVSLGAELGWRTALITQTVDKNSLDATLRLDTHF